MEQRFCSLEQRFYTPLYSAGITRVRASSIHITNFWGDSKCEAEIGDVSPSVIQAMTSLKKIPRSLGFSSGAPLTFPLTIPPPKKGHLYAVFRPHFFKQIIYISFQIIMDDSIQGLK